MELRSIQSPAVSSIPRSNLIEKPFVHAHFIRSFNVKRYPHSRNLKLVHFKVQASGAAKLGSQAVEKSTKDDNVKDENIVFVAGATGKVGSRTVRELLKLGFKVRAGVRSAQRAQPLVKSVQQMKLGKDATPAVEMLELVECDLEKKEQIGPALSNSSIVICCIGASEKEIFDITGPFRIDYQATKNLIDAATVAKVKHFILLTSLGTNKVGFPAAILNLFWGVLIWKRKAEEALLASGIPYTIVRPGGMERPTDSYKETHNLTLSLEDTLFGGQVSNLQVAELLAFMAKNFGPSCCKVVEVIAETTAPLTPMGQLLTKIPSQRPGCPPEEPAVADKPEPVVADKPEPVSTSVSSESSSSSPEKESTPSKPAPPRPSSPYFAYEDLKPPVSPTPKAPSGSKEVVNAVETKPDPALVGSETTTSPEATAEPELVAAEVKISRPLSPYTAKNSEKIIFGRREYYYSYEDLKSPVSPSPKAPGGKEVNIIETVAKPTPADSEASLSSTTIKGTAEPEVAAIGVQKPSVLSPYAAYDDLKPPTSPSPSSPSVSIPPTIPTENGGLTSAQTVTKSRPLSPFAMYEDLKPPTSPTPSSP